MRDRTAILTQLTKYCIQASYYTLKKHQVPAHLVKAVVGKRTVGIGVKVKDPTKVSKAIDHTITDALAHSTGLIGVVPDMIGPVLYYQFPIPEYSQRYKCRLWEDIYKINAHEPTQVGISYDNQPVHFRFTDAPHAMIVGTTGSGKTQLLKTILYSLLISESPDTLRLVLVDPKRELEGFDNVMHLEYPIASSLENIRQVIYGFHREYQLRREAQDFRSAQRWVLVLDEADKAVVLGDKRSEELVRTVARDGRSYNMNLIVSTHKPTTAALGETIEYLDNQWLGRFTRAVTSGHIEGGLNLHRLTGRGDMLHHTNGEHTRFQALLTKDEDIARLPKHEKGLSYPVYQTQRDTQDPFIPSPEIVGYYLSGGAESVTEQMAASDVRLDVHQHQDYKRYTKLVEKGYQRWNT